MRVVNKYNYKISPELSTTPVCNIMRPGIFGNPFVIGTDGTRDEVIQKFEEYARNNKTLLEDIRNLEKDTVLLCCCKPRPCHGDVIVKLWKELHGNKST